MTLQFYKIHKPIIIQVDAPKTGLWTSILHNGKPVEFMSKTLAPDKQCHANTEFELLAIIFGGKCFHV